MTDSNGADQPLLDGNGAAPGQPAVQFRVLAQFTRDLSFENPNGPRTPGGESVQPQLEVSVNVGARPREQDHYEVDLNINVSAKAGETTLFLTELSYGGIFLIQNVPQDSIQPVLLIECPRLLFPFARRVIADTTRDGGFPPLMLEPIDFVALYRAQLERQQQQAQDDAVENAPTL